VERLKYRGAEHPLGPLRSQVQAEPELGAPQLWQRRQLVNRKS